VIGLAQSHANILSIYVVLDSFLNADKGSINKRLGLMNQITAK